MKMTTMRAVPELVAPAGSLAAFQAGIEAGADAFYVGIGKWNARARARNFGLEELEAVVGAARDKGKKIYLALNILIRDSEIEEIVPILERAEAFRVDAVILQDLGLLSLMRREFPSLHVHASTQMFLHNSLHVQALAQRGVRRVILPRELCLEEIRAIRSRCEVEIEVFVHGALCFSFSGLCLASSWLFGFDSSGNRGSCRQVCRFAFEGGPARYPFSMKDLEGRSHLERLLQAGVDGLKIEGRLRSADYVGEVVGYYRSCLDAWASGNALPAPPRQWRYGRRTAAGFFGPLSYDRMVFSEGDGQPWTGELVGTVARVRRGKAAITFSKTVYPGDRLRILADNGVKIRELTWIGRSRDRGEIEVEDRSSARVEWKVYRLGTSRAPTVRSLGCTPGRLKTCAVELIVRYGGGRLEVEAFEQGAGLLREPFVLNSDPGKRPLPLDRVRDCFTRTDRSPFRVADVRVLLEDPLAVSVAELNRIRRAFFSRLELERDRRQAARNEARRQRIRDGLAALRAEERGPEDAPAIQPVPWPDFAAVREKGRSSDGMLWVELPLFVSEGRLEALCRQIEGLLGDEKIGFVCHSLGWIDWLGARIDSKRIASGSYLYCLNRWAVRFLIEAGCSHVLVSPDFPEQDRKDLLRQKGTVLPIEKGKRGFVTRLAVPARRFKRENWALETIRRAEYTELVLPEAD